ncbi:golgin-45 [Culicoides brevitarsis]|uniref:golgin-45 n=1 Tax=Culicoides brevitarsis TaxID=469753 RepID=UPI00307CAD7F
MSDSKSISAQRESGDGAPCPEAAKSLATAKVPANLATSDDVTVRNPTKFDVKTSQKLQRITQEIQNTWLRRHLNKPRPASRLLDLEEQRKQIILPAVLPKGRLIQLIPLVKQPKDPRKSVSRNQKELKFVPYEPYKACVTPMCKRSPRKSPMEKGHKRGKSTNVDLNVLVSQVSSVKSSEIREKPSENSQKAFYEAQIEALRKEKSEIEKKLKFQAQVNSELKSLLVNSMSQDESVVSDRISSVTEGVHLKEALKLITSAEDYSGQIEVWRSRFLASGVMIEELARWKTSLLQRNQLLIQSNKKLLETVGRCRDMQVEILSNLAFLEGTSTKLDLESANILDLSKENLSLSQHLALKSTAKGGLPNEIDFAGLETLTEGEKLGIQALETTKEPLISTDELLKTILGQNFMLMQQQKKAQDENLVDPGPGMPKIV